MGTNNENCIKTGILSFRANAMERQNSEHFHKHNDHAISRNSDRIHLGLNYPLLGYDVALIVNG